RPSQARRSAHPTDCERASRQPDPVPPGILQLIDGWTSNPAYVENKFTDVLAANTLATALSPNYAPGVNLLRAILLDESERELLRDWEELTAAGIAALRANIGPDVDDPYLAELVDEMSVRSEHFRRLWGRHDVHPKRPGVTRLRHPKVGDLELHASKLAIIGTDGLILKVLHAEPGSRSAELLAILGSLAAPGTSQHLTGSDDHQAVDEQ
ncbi:transcriptional regulator, partial [Streptomyces sp. NPDC020951]